MRQNNKAQNVIIRQILEEKYTLQVRPYKKMKSKYSRRFRRNKLKEIGHKRFLSLRKFPDE